MIQVRPAPREDIARVMFDPEIWDRTTEDRDPPKESLDIRQANMRGWTFIGGYVNKEIASLFIIRGSQLHFWVLREYRTRARELLRESFKLWPHDVWCEIPEIYRSVINFAKKSGFKEAGIKRNAHMKNGKLCDLHILRYVWAI